MQADAGREQSLPRIFTRTNGKEFDYVFNCGGETRYSQDDSVYKVRSLDLSLTLGRECARRKIPAFIEFSTGMVYKPPSSSTISSGGCTESAPLKPWLKMAKYKLMAEEGLQKLGKEQGLRYAVLRLAHVYGEYDVGFLARGLCLARVYQSKGEEMKWLYGKELRINTVHVEDACTAAWKAAEWCARVRADDPELKNGGRVFNIVDKGDTSQPQRSYLPSQSFPSTATHLVKSHKSKPELTHSSPVPQKTAQALLSTLISTHFHIPTGFVNPLISTFARFNLDSVVDDVNEDVLQPWADLLSGAGITRPGPISPWMERELLRDCDLCLNPGRAGRVLGWTVGREHERLREGEVASVVGSYRRMGWWP
ncbi:hypothetical protein MMC24_000450 [Lignoscripta atroalba]|nr:hypothetical protein [Lignoscripta atroalba]